MIAAFVRRGPSRCRSRQFSETFSCPPTNHFAFGALQSSTCFHGLRHVSSFASRAKNFSGCSTLSFHIFLYCCMDLIRALFAKALAGLKTRFSTRVDSMLVLMGGCG